MSQIIEYKVHDCVNLTEATLDDFDTEKLIEAENQGAIFIAIYDDGTRERVSAKDIVQPEPVVNGFTVVQPKYIDERVRALIDLVQTVYDRLGNVRVHVNGIVDDAEFDKAYGAALDKIQILLDVETSEVADDNA